jgi:hypothetical protein
VPAFRIEADEMGVEAVLVGRPEAAELFAGTGRRVRRSVAPNFMLHRTIFLFDIRPK